MSISPIRVLVAAVLLVAPLAPRSTVGAQTPKGDLWEVTSQMSMEGMPMKMPARTHKVCRPTEWTEPPNDQKNCKSSNMKTEGSKVTWDMECTDPAMKGTGEILREGTDAYTGAIKFTSDRGNATVNLKGKKIGPCDKPE
jgi:hypothetical protein